VYLTVFSCKTSIKYFYTIILSSKLKTDARRIFTARYYPNIMAKMKNRVSFSRRTEILSLLHSSEIMYAVGGRASPLPLYTFFLVTPLEVGGSRKISPYNLHSLFYSEFHKKQSDTVKLLVSSVFKNISMCNAVVCKFFMIVHFRSIEYR